MTLGTIVDTRPDANEDLSESLGTFLGYYLVRIAGDGDVALDDLTRRIAPATRVKKQRRSYLDSAVNLRVASAIWPHLKPERRSHFARRALPLTAGISNLYVRDSWIDQQGAGRILDFHRACLQWTGTSARYLANDDWRSDEHRGHLSRDGVFTVQDRRDHAVVRGAIGDARRPRAKRKTRKSPVPSRTYRVKTYLAVRTL